MFSDDTGGTYWVGAVAPSAVVPSSDPIGNAADLLQVQYFKKTDPDARLRLIVSRTFFEAIDSNSGEPTATECPWHRTRGFGDCLKSHVRVRILLGDGVLVLRPNDSCCKLEVAPRSTDLPAAGTSTPTPTPEARGRSGAIPTRLKSIVMSMGTVADTRSQRFYGTRDRRASLVSAGRRLVLCGGDGQGGHVQPAAARVVPVCLFPRSRRIARLEVHIHRRRADRDTGRKARARPSGGGSGVHDRSRPGRRHAALPAGQLSNPRAGAWRRRNHRDARERQARSHQRPAHGGRRDGSRRQRLHAGRYAGLVSRWPGRRSPGHHSDPERRHIRGTRNDQPHAVRTIGMRPTGTPIE